MDHGLSVKHEGADLAARALAFVDRALHVLAERHLQRFDQRGLSADRQPSDDFEAPPGRAGRATCAESQAERRRTCGRGGLASGPVAELASQAVDDGQLIRHPLVTKGAGRRCRPICYARCDRTPRCGLGCSFWVCPQRHELRQATRSVLFDGKNARDTNACKKTARAIFYIGYDTVERSGLRHRRNGVVLG